MHYMMSWIVRPVGFCELCSVAFRGRARGGIGLWVGSLGRIRGEGGHF